MTPLLHQGQRALLLPVLAFLATAARSAPVLCDPPPGRLQPPLRGLARIRVPFVENGGQFSDGIAFSAATLFGAAFVTRDGRLLYAVERKPAHAEEALPRSEALGQALGETFVSGEARAVGGLVGSAGVSRFVGNDPRHRQKNVLRSYEDVRLGEVWPGISVLLRARAGSVEKVFTVQPGARVAQIQLRVDGARRLAADRNGSLIVQTGGVPVSFSAPTAFQQRNGVRRPVPVAYTLAGSTYGFRLGSHDPGLPVVIDPVLQSTYVGGGEADAVNAIVVHPSTGEVLVAGTTFSSDLPRAAGGARGVSGGAADAFVARFDSSLTTLLQLTYLGGSGGEEGLGLAVHPSSGDVYVAGYTTSPDFPGTSGGARSTRLGGEDAFVARLDRTLTRLFRTTYFGGNDADKAVAVGVHPSNGDVYIAGQTLSTDLQRFANGAQPSNAGDVDGFVARFDPTLATLLQASYVGGSYTEYLRAMAFHPSTGEIYVGGQTTSIDFPGTPGGATGGANGNWDGFLARLDPTLSAPVQATYLGGAGADDILGIAVHPVRGEVFVTGWTQFVDFPGTAGGAQPAAGGSAGSVDSFVARFNPELTALLQATFLGGSDGDYGYSIAVHPSQGDVYVTGETFSTDLPGAAGGAQAAPSGRGDAFVARFDPTLTALVQTTYLGGQDEDIGHSVAFEPSSGDLIVAGATSSTVLPAAAFGAQRGYAGGSDFGGDGFLSRLPASLREEGGGCVSPDPLCSSPGRLPIEPPARRTREACELPCH